MAGAGTAMVALAVNIEAGGDAGVLRIEPRRRPRQEGTRMKSNGDKWFLYLHGERKWKVLDAIMIAARWVKSPCNMSSTYAGLKKFVH